MSHRWESSAALCLVLLKESENCGRLYILICFDELLLSTQIAKFCYWKKKVSNHLQYLQYWANFLNRQSLWHVNLEMTCSSLIRNVLTEVCNAGSLVLPVKFNTLNPELNPICYLLALLGAHHFLHVSRIRVKLLTFRLLMSHIYGAPILDASRSHTTTQHSR